MIEYLYRQITSEPALITPQAHAAIQRLIEAKIATGEFIREGEGACGEKIDLPGMVKDDNGIAHIPIGGAIGQKLRGFAKGRGAVDVGDVSAEIDDAMADKKVRAILFDFDSPGGMVSGTPELAAKIKGLSKPKYAFSSGLVASAAMWIASSCDLLCGTMASEWGSIGVFVPFADLTRMAEMEGVKIDIIKAGKLKAAGYPGTALSEAQRAHIQSMVDDIYGMFTAHVRTMRKARGAEVSDDTMQGQTFLAGEAMKRGLIDGVVSSKQEMIRMIR